MGTSRNFISVISGLLLLTHCNTKKCEDKQNPANSVSFVTRLNTNLTGEWIYNFPFYSSELILKDDKTFTFHDQGCYGQRFSQGNWTNEDSTIQLTSFDWFRPEEQDDKSMPPQVITPSKVKGKSKKRQVEYSFDGLRVVQLPVIPGLNDTVRVYLNKIKLLVRNDTLYCEGSNKLPEGAKLHLKKNNR